MAGSEAKINIMDKNKIYRITSKRRLPMKKLKALSYYSFPLFILSISCLIIIKSDILSFKASISSIVIASIFMFLSLITFIRQFHELRLSMLVTDNTDKENFNLLKVLFKSFGFQLDITNQHYFKAVEQYRSCKFYIFLIDKKVFYTYTYDIDGDTYGWFKGNPPIKYLFISILIRAQWKTRLKKLLTKAKFHGR